MFYIKVRLILKIATCIYKDFPTIACRSIFLITLKIGRVKRRILVKLNYNHKLKPLRLCSLGITLLLLTPFTCYAGLSSIRILTCPANPVLSWCYLLPQPRSHISFADVIRRPLSLLGFCNLSREGTPPGPPIGHQSGKLKKKLDTGKIWKKKSFFGNEGAAKCFFVKVEV